MGSLSLTVVCRCRVGVFVLLFDAWAIDTLPSWFDPPNCSTCFPLAIPSVIVGNGMGISGNGLTVSSKHVMEAVCMSRPWLWLGPGNNHYRQTDIQVRARAKFTPSKTRTFQASSSSKATTLKPLNGASNGASNGLSMRPLNGAKAGDLRFVGEPIQR